MMMDDQIPPTPYNQDTPPELLPVQDTAQTEEQTRRQLYGIIAVVVLVVIGSIIGAVFLYKAPAETTSQIRDIFIIFMALESLVIGVALVILMIQLATLINLLQNEIKPIIYSTNDTVNTLRGTATFLSKNLTEPVIKLNEYVAALSRLIDIFRPTRRF